MAYNTDPEAAYQAQLDQRTREDALRLIGGAGSDAAGQFGLGPSIEKAWSMGPGAIGRGIMGTNTFEPTVYPINETASERDRFLARQARIQQAGLAGRLEDTMDGKGPTVAGLQMRQGIAEAMRNAGTQAANARGTSRALAQRSAIYGGLAAQQQANRDAGLLQAQEQLAARGQSAALSGQMRQGDIATRGQDIGIEQGNQQAWGQHEGYMTNISEGNAQRKQKGTGAIMSTVGSLLAGPAGGALSDIRAKEDIVDESYGEKISKALTPQQIISPVGAPTQDSMWGYPVQPPPMQYEAVQPPPPPPPEPEKKEGGIMGSLGGGMMSGGSILSDSRSKERIRQLENELEGRGPRKLDMENPFASRENLAPLRPYSFTYKPDIAAALAEKTAQQFPSQKRDSVRGEVYADARSPRMGIMAQDLERSPGGRDVVGESALGKYLDEKRAVAFTMANQAGMNKRLNHIEEALGYG